MRNLAILVRPDEKKPTLEERVGDMAWKAVGADAVERRIQDATLTASILIVDALLAGEEARATELLLVTKRWHWRKFGHLRRLAP